MEMYPLALQKVRLEIINLIILYSGPPQLSLYPGPQIMLSPGPPTSEHLSPPSSWSVYSHSNYPGLLVVKGAFSPDGLTDLLSKLLLDYQVQDKCGADVRFYYFLYLKTF